MQMDLNTMAQKGRKKGLPVDVETVLAFDPGETTGFAAFGLQPEIELIDHAQLVTKKFPHLVDVLRDAIMRRTSTLYRSVIVVEDYHVYGNKLKQHANSRVHTTRVIGAIETIVADLSKERDLVGPIFQTAGQVKPFCTDSKLRMWDLYIEGERHTRDAIRHAAYWILFGQLKDS